MKIQYTYKCPEDTVELDKAVKLLELEQAKRRVAAMMVEIGIEG